MKYRYFYQTKTNENRDGWVTARNRAEAYATLRKQGIRPYRVVGDDPLRWQPWAIGAVVVLLSLGLAAALWFRVVVVQPQEEVRRCQLTGDSAVIAAGLASGWAEVFPLALDRHLAQYAQPGQDVARPDVTEEALAAFAADLEQPAPAADEADGPEIRQLKAIVGLLRREMADRRAEGGSLRDYLEFLEWRQQDERAYQQQAYEQVRRAPDSLREKARINTNLRLREMGLPEIGE